MVRGCAALDHTIATEGASVTPETQPKPFLSSLLSYLYFSSEVLGCDWPCSARIILRCCQPFPEKESFLEKTGPVEKYRGRGRQRAILRAPCVAWCCWSLRVLWRTAGGPCSWVGKPSRSAEGLGTAGQREGLWFGYLAERVTFASFFHLPALLAPPHSPCPPLSPHTEACVPFLPTKGNPRERNRFILPGGAQVVYLSVLELGFKRDLLVHLSRGCVYLCLEDFIFPTEELHK